MMFSCNTSGGLGSWAASKLTAEAHGTDNLLLVFADTLIESSALYRFLIEGTANILGLPSPELLARRALNLVPATREHMVERKEALAAIRREAMVYFKGRLVWLAEGRTPWEVFRDERFLGNSRVDPCSKILKRQLLDSYFETHHPRPTTMRVVGLGWWERKRFEGDGKKKVGMRKRMAENGWVCVAPLIDHRPVIDRHDLKAWAEREGLELSSAYDDGFEHDNCGGECVKAGQSHWLNMLKNRPDTFRNSESEENSLRELLGDVSMMVETRAGVKTPLPLTMFRERVERGEETCLFGGAPCGCFTGDD